MFSQKHGEHDVIKSDLMTFNKMQLLQYWLYVCL